MVMHCDEWTLSPDASAEAKEEFEYASLGCEAADGVNSAAMVIVPVSRCPTPPEFVGRCTVTDWRGHRGITHTEFIYFPSEREVAESDYLQFNEQAERECTMRSEEGVYEPSTRFDSSSGQ